jgi:hypothetical protein
MGGADPRGGELLLEKCERCAVQTRVPPHTPRRPPRYLSRVRTLVLKEAPAREAGGAGHPERLFPGSDSVPSEG